MPPVRPDELPDDSFLRTYRRDGHYADCWSLTLPAAISQAQYVEAFYTTWLFRLERWLLRWLVARPSTDAQAAQLARGEREGFAAWSVERRGESQLLMCDFQGATRSWLMSVPAPGGTKLYFGSAVVPRRDARSGELRLGRAYSLLLGIHKLYSRALLAAASRRLRRATAL
jgi:hypothetical protein